MLREYVIWILELVLPSDACRLLLGYAIPAYKCFRTIEQDRPEIEEFRFWCQYWIIMGFLTVIERLADVFFSWLPFYSKAKIALIIYLWHPKTRGTWYIYNRIVVHLLEYIYNRFVMPLLARFEPRNRRMLLEVVEKTEDLLFFYIKNFLEKGQSLFFELSSYFVREASGPPPSQGSGRATQPAPSAPPMPTQDSRHRHRGGRNSRQESESEGQVYPNGSTELERLIREGPFDYLQNEQIRRRHD